MAFTPIRTVNQVKEAFRRIASAHRQINEFYWGPAYDFASSGSTSYPAMLVDVLNTSTIDRTQITLNLVIHIADKERAGQTNEDDILSDCLQIAKDVSAEIKNDDQLTGWTWDVDKDAKWRFEFFRYEEKDILAGVIFYPTIKINTVDDTCQIPEDSITRI